MNIDFLILITFTPSVRFTSNALVLWQMHRLTAIQPIKLLIKVMIFYGTSNDADEWWWWRRQRFYAQRSVEQHINACCIEMMRISHFSFVSFVFFFSLYNCLYNGWQYFYNNTDTASCSSLNRCNQWGVFISFLFYSFFALISLWHNHNGILFDDKCTHWWTRFFLWYMWLIAMTTTTTTTTGKKYVAQQKIELRCRVIQCNQVCNNKNTYYWSIFFIGFRC